jgi:hypothetical protein
MTDKKPVAPAELLLTIDDFCATMDWQLERDYPQMPASQRAHISLTILRPLLEKAQASEAAASVALDGDTRRACNDPNCANDWPCALHPEKAQAQEKEND